MNTDKSKVSDAKLQEEDLENVTGGTFGNRKVGYRKCKRCGGVFAYNPLTDYGRELAMIGLCIHCKKGPQ